MDSLEEVMKEYVIQLENKITFIKEGHEKSNNKIVSSKKPNVYSAKQPEYKIYISTVCNGL
jgi:hypothetical protein